MSTTFMDSAYAHEAQQEAEPVAPDAPVETVERVVSFFRCLGDGSTNGMPAFEVFKSVMVGCASKFFDHSDFVQVKGVLHGVVTEECFGNAPRLVRAGVEGGWWGVLCAVVKLLLALPGKTIVLTTPCVREMVRDACDLRILLQASKRDRVNYGVESAFEAPSKKGVRELHVNFFDGHCSKLFLVVPTPEDSTPLPAADIVIVQDATDVNEKYLRTHIAPLVCSPGVCTVLTLPL